jgi:MYXO-CTERM domain-containing protein
MRQSILIRALALLAGCAAMLLVNRSVSAQTVVYNNFGPDDTFDNSGAWFGGQTNLGWSIQANELVPTDSGHLTKITAAIRHGGGGTDFQLSLCDDSNITPGTELARWTGHTFPRSDTITLTPSDGPWLEAGHRYWIVATTSDLVNTFQIWSAGLGERTHRNANLDTHGPTVWEVASNVTGWAMRVEVPEPGFLGIAALAALGALRRRPPATSK